MFPDRGRPPKRAIFSNRGRPPFPDARRPARPSAATKAFRGRRRRVPRASGVMFGDRGIFPKLPIPSFVRGRFAGPRDAGKIFGLSRICPTSDRIRLRRRDVRGGKIRFSPLPGDVFSFSRARSSRRNPGVRSPGTKGVREGRLRVSFFGAISFVLRFDAGIRDSIRGDAGFGRPARAESLGDETPVVVGVLRSFNKYKNRGKLSRRVGRSGAAASFRLFAAFEGETTTCGHEKRRGPPFVGRSSREAPLDADFAGAGNRVFFRSSRGALF
jgi:hypothetical protein